MNFKVTVRAQDNQVVEIREGLLHVILVALLTRRITVMDMQRALAAIICAYRAFIIKKIQDFLASCLSVFTPPQFKWQDASFASPSSGMIIKIIGVTFPEFTEPFASPQALRLSPAGRAANVAGRVWSELHTTIQAPFVFHVSIITHGKLFVTWKTFGAIAA